MQAFTAATRQMLDSVHQELSNGLASGETQVNIVPQNDAPLSRAEQPSTFPSQNEPTLSAQSSVDNPALEADQLLAKLKAQLAEQMNQ